LNDPSEDCILFIHLRAIAKSEEKVGPVGVGADVASGEETLLVMFNPVVFILDSASIDSLMSKSVCCDDSTTLQELPFQEVLEDPVGVGQILGFSHLLTGTKSSKVLSG